MIKVLKIPIWNRKLLIVTPPHDILKAVRRYKFGRELISLAKNDPPEGEDMALVYMCDSTGRYVIWFKNRKPSIDTIIHETNHIVKHMMKFIGANNEREANAYSQEYLFNEVRKALRIKTPK